MLWRLLSLVGRRIVLIWLLRLGIARISLRWWLATVVRHGLPEF